MSLLGSFGWSARTNGWAVLDSLRIKELICNVVISIIIYMGLTKNVMV